MDTPTADGAAHYLAGMIDGEGTIGVYRNPWVHRSCRIVSTDRELIDACSEACLILGIEHRVRSVSKQPPRKQAWELSIGTIAALRVLAERVPLRHIGKRKRLAEALDSVRASYRPPRETLERLYVFEGQSSGEIGRLLGVRGTTVMRWLRDDGIPVRSASEAGLLRWSKEGEA